MALVSQALELFAGTSETFPVSLTRIDGTTPLDLTTAADIVLLAKLAYSDDDSAARISKALQVTTVTISGAPTGGTFTITVGGQTTAGIAHDATASAVKTALEALSSVGAGNSIIGGGPGPATPYTVTLINAAAGQAVAASGAGLTGGTSPAAVPTTVGTITILDAAHGMISVPLVPTDTNNISFNTTLFGHVKVFFADGTEKIGATVSVLADRNAVRRI